MAVVVLGAGVGYLLQRMFAVESAFAFGLLGGFLAAQLVPGGNCGGSGSART